MQTWDSDFIKRVMTNRRIWPHISDDFAPPPDQFEPVMAPGIYYLAPEHDGQRVGVFMYMPHSTILFEVHTCILPLYRGGPAIKAARNSLAWMIENTACQKVITHVPASNTLALRFARAVGMQDEGTNRASYMKRGELLDQHLLGITREEIRACQQRQ